MPNRQQSIDALIEDTCQARICKRQRVGGGDFAAASQLLLESGEKLFVKTHADPPPNFFTTEATGLTWLRESATVAVPAVRLVSDEPPVLALQWIDIGHPVISTEEQFGHDLAALHKASFDGFGRPDKRTTGSLALQNTPCDSWVRFYAECRLLPLAALAHDRQALSSRTVSAVEAVAARLADYDSDDVSPALLHGDLWAGNRVVDCKGQSWIIDPAAHGGHREFDLAMMRLFGGYADRCFSAYQEVFPLSPGWQQRIALHQLAPLIVHAIKFGGPYASAVEEALDRL